MNFLSAYQEIFFFACILWLVFLSAYIWWKARMLFRRQTMLAQRIEVLKDKNLNPIQLEVEKHSRLFELSERGRQQKGDEIPSRFTAQFGEDVILYDFFNDKAPGFFIEAGAYDGVTFSNTYLLESLGWKGLLVEPHPRMAELCRRHRPGCVVKECALGQDGVTGVVEFTCADDPRGGAPLSFLEASHEHIDRCHKEQCTFEKVSVDLVSLNALLESITETVDFLSLDVEGMELAVLQGFDLTRFRPKSILIEQNLSDSDKLVAFFLEKYGYIPAGVVGCNCFYTTEKYEAQLSHIICDFLR